MKDFRKAISESKSFDWDTGNIEKNLIKHKVRFQECEEVFFNNPFFRPILLTEKIVEQRYYAFGITDRRRKLTIVFTIRKGKIRVVSARDMSRKERRFYDEKV
ncbi:MAG: BrnT family toxin [Elusimicrobiota bacterium]|nr:BrnT family toxin [Elusimicrobiota bacterium]